ncbi:MAG TPA: UDP-N-acetylmuramoyl-L-alanyl-D-glutamate--2,6-diaminopimelate ligase [Acidimicrobiia bacterium]|nr:UDP-N-acetylmuramoyl-L-alanyl-D-glutamate--2,6-diaminopimelate ligase [Acidimicrobiia bacterium]
MPAPVNSMAALTGLVEGRLLGDGAIEVTDATHDSRQARDGSLYIAVVGNRVDGHDFATGAVAGGAVGLVVERELSLPVPQIIVTNSRTAMAPLAAAIHGYPSYEMAIIGITGTNGKTTVTHFLEAIAHSAGRKCGLIGTIETRLEGQVIPNPHTTPEATDFQRLLREMADAGAEMVACEVSSHALALNRVDTTRFEVAAFTNLSQDHLDLHGSMDSYFEAKAQLFEMAEKKAIWIDDPYGTRLAARHQDALLVGGGGSVRATGVVSDTAGTSFLLHLPDGVVPVRTQIPGSFNLANALIAAAAAHLVEFSPKEIGDGLSGLSSVPGRFEIVSTRQGFSVVVDYAHTPEGIASVIATARSLARGRVIAVVGAGGDRDRAKRPAMGKAVSSADLVVVTSDNPRTEDPEAIIDQVMAGVDTPSVVRVSDRREAIAAALGSARTGDVVLVLGKGHETGQEIAGVIHAFDDRQVVQGFLEGPTP